MTNTLHVGVPAGRTGRLPMPGSRERRYVGRGPAPDFTPLPDGEHVADDPDIRRAIATGDLELRTPETEEHAS